MFNQLACCDIGVIILCGGQDTGRICEQNQVSVYGNLSYWQCMDTCGEMQQLESQGRDQSATWHTWNG